MKITILVIFGCAIVGIAFSSPVSKSELAEVFQLSALGQRNNALEQQLLNALESLREIMITGTDGIPVLEPLDVDRIDIDGEDIGLLGSHVTIERLNLKHLSTFEIESLRLRLTSLILQRYTLDIEGNIPVIDFTIDNYDLNINAEGLSLFGKGDARILIHKPRVTAKVVLSPSIRIGAIYIKIISCDIKLSLSAFEPAINGLFLNSGASDFVNLFLKHLVPELIEFFEEEISAFLGKTIVEVGNEILGDLNLIDILN